MHEKSDDAKQQNSRPKQRRLNVREMPPSQEQVMEIGRQLGEALRGAPLNIAVQNLRARWQEDFASSAPGETVIREAIYHKTIALGELLEEMAALVQAAEALSEREKMEQRIADDAWADRSSLMRVIASTG